MGSGLVCTESGWLGSGRGRSGAATISRVFQTGRTGTSYRRQTLRRDKDYTDKKS
jgi:hypothetical protein